MKISRAWCMPNSATFEMPPIRRFVERYSTTAKCIVDPFSGTSQIGHYLNDVAYGGIDAIAFLEMLIKARVRADLLIVDPPYSPRQMKECYPRNTLDPRKQCNNASLMKEIRDCAKRLIVKGGFVLSFGWNSNGMGKPFEKCEILIVAHGASHNDTICVAEKLT